ncbi:MAG: pyridoxal-phosphate dependent enzyme [Anaerolineaceae bacterium]|nr:pyridoxal-phosphate dependent enzyme [Anaerolineaceae bacterium]
MTSNVKIKCTLCGNISSFSAAKPRCPVCDNIWQEAVYPLEKLKDLFLNEIRNLPFDLWRYHNLLPLNTYKPKISMDEGGTPLLHASNLGVMLGNKNIYFKDERQNPTGSFKDRQAALTIAALQEAGINQLVLASTGNVAISYSAYASRAAIKCWAFLTSLVPYEKMREVAIYGTQVIKITGSYDQTKRIASEFAEQRNLFHDLGAKSIPCVESMKTIAFEISEQLTLTLSPSDIRDKWIAPDWYIQAVSGGLGPVGVIKGFQELYDMGIIDKIPKIGVIQAEGCSPMVTAWKANKPKADPVLNPSTHIETLATGDPGKTYEILYEKISTVTGGTFESVTDEEAYQMMHFLSKMEGLSVEAAAAVSFAGVSKLMRLGTIKPDEMVVINCTGHTMPVQNDILGSGWSMDINLKKSRMEPFNQDGLLAALSEIKYEKYPKIIIIDDDTNARILIKRILQSMANFELFEAANGLAGLEKIRSEKPNLIILDLMMPELDGFGVLDEIQKDESIKDIPVIIVSAKELTESEKVRLKNHIHGLMQKGDFGSIDLQSEVSELLKLT